MLSACGENSITILFINISKIVVNELGVKLSTNKVAERVSNANLLAKMLQHCAK